MDYLTSLIKKEIKQQFKSVRQFSMVIGVPYTTVASALKNGISGTGFETVLKMCKELNINTVYDGDFELATGESSDIAHMFDQLDEIGKHTARAVLQAEYNRCNVYKIRGDIVSNGETGTSEQSKDEEAVTQ